MKQIVTSGSPFETEIGFSRAVRVGHAIAISGTAPIGPDGQTVSPGDVYGQTKRCLEIIKVAVEEAGGKIEDVARTRIMLTSIDTWRDGQQCAGVSILDFGNNRRVRVCRTL